MAFFYLRLCNAAIACFDNSITKIDPDRENANTQKNEALRMLNQVKAAISDKLK